MFLKVILNIFVKCVKKKQILQDPSTIIVKYLLECLNMTQHISIIGANSALGRELITELLKLNKKVLASDLCGPPVWFNSLPENSCQWIELNLKKHEALAQVIEGASCLFLIPHQSLITQHFKTKKLANCLLFLAYWITVYSSQFKLSKIIYLSAMINRELPKTSILYNQFEIENILKEGQTPVISLRLPLLIMNEIEPFNIIKNIITAFPFTIFPAWIEKQVQPIYWKDVLEILIQLLLDNSYTKIHRNINLPGPDLISYKMLLILVARKLKLKRQILLSNLFPLSITAFIQSLFLNYSSLMLKRWYQSWNQDAVALISDWKQKKSWVGVEDALKLVLNQPIENKKTVKISCTDKSVLVLRTESIGQLKAKELSLEFFYWLQNYFFSIIRFEIKDNMWRVYFPQKLILLLELELLSQNEDQLTFIFRCCAKAKRPQMIYLTINHFYLKKRKFAFLKFKSESGDISYFAKKMVVFIFNRFNQYLLH